MLIIYLRVRVSSSDSSLWFSVNISHATALQGGDLDYDHFKTTERPWRMNVHLQLKEGLRNAGDLSIVLLR